METPRLGAFVWKRTFPRWAGIVTAVGTVGNRNWPAVMVQREQDGIKRLLLVDESLEVIE